MSNLKIASSAPTAHPRNDELRSLRGSPEGATEAIPLLTHLKRNRFLKTLFLP